MPSNWREFEAIPLELIWQEEPDSGESFVASEEILWWYPETDEDEEGYDFAELMLRVAAGGDDAAVWEVVLSEEAAGDNDPVLASGAEPSLEAAKAVCEATALVLVAEQERLAADG